MMQRANYSFRETSRLFRPAFLFSFLPVFVIMAWLFFDQRAKRDNLGVILSIVTIVICTVALCFMFLLKLTTTITDEGIAFKYAPTMRQFKLYPWEQIASVSIVSYNPIQDFGGWGLKKSKKYGKGYTTKGNKGLWIQLTDGQSILLSVFAIEDIKTILPHFLAKKLLQ